MRADVINKLSVSGWVNRSAVGMAFILGLLAFSLVFLPNHAAAAIGQPAYTGIPLDVLGAPYADANYTNYNLASDSYNPPSTSSPGYGGAESLPSIAYFDNPNGTDGNCLQNNGGTAYSTMIRSWASSQSQGTQYDGSSYQPITETSGQTSIALQFNNLEYVCYQDTATTSGSNKLTTNVRGPTNAYPVTDTTQLANNTYLPSTTNYQIASYTATSVLANGTYVPSAGSITCLTGQKDTINYQASTRYWTGTQTTGVSGCSGNNFTFTPTDNYSQTVTLTVYQWGVSTFYNPASKSFNIYRCLSSNAVVDSPNVPPNASDPNDQCAASAITLTLNITGPPVTVQANVFGVNQAGTSGQIEFSGIYVNTCGGNGEYQDTTDDWEYYSVPEGETYCDEVTGTPYSSSSPAYTYPGGVVGHPFIPGYDGPFTRPWDYGTGTGYPSVDVAPNPPIYPASPSAVCGPFDFDSLQTHCSENYYNDCQTSGLSFNPDACGYNTWDRTSDSGVDLEYVQLLAASPPVTPSPTPTCTISTVPAQAVVGQPYQLKYTITNNAAITPLVFNASGNPYGVSETIPAALGIASSSPPDGTQINPGGASFSYLSATGSPTSSSQYTVTMTINAQGFGQVGNCTGTIVIAAAPYFRAFGGDVLSGVDSADVESCFDNLAGIYSYNNGIYNNNLGAGTTLASLAAGSINEFVSGQSNALSANLDPLSFANSGAGWSSLPYGGNYASAPVSCSGQDYYSQASSIGNCTISGGVVTIAAMNLTPGSGSGHQYACKTTANVNITGNITYSGLSSATATDLPSFEVITRGGNIVINTNVSQVAGTLIAEKWPGGVGSGTIYDTTNELVDEPPSSDNAQNTTDADRLAIYGSFVANELALYRSYGTESDDSSAITTPPDSFDAEEFDYSPINWLNSSSVGSTSSKVEAITSLPPIL